MNKLLLGGVLIGGGALLASCVQIRSGEPALVVTVERDGEGCRLTVKGERVTTDRLFEKGRSARGRRGIVLYDKETPFRCLGGAIFTLQRAGLSFVDAAMWDGS